jgi:hypothetical protein
MKMSYDQMLPEAAWAESLEIIYHKPAPKGQSLDALVA